MLWRDMYTKDKALWWHNRLRRETAGRWAWRLSFYQIWILQGLCHLPCHQEWNIHYQCPSFGYVNVNRVQYEVHIWKTTIVNFCKYKLAGTAQVECEFHPDKVATLFHHDEEARRFVKGWEEYNEYQRAVTYLNDFSLIKAVKGAFCKSLYDFFYS